MPCRHLPWNCPPCPTRICCRNAHPQQPVQCHGVGMLVVCEQFRTTLPAHPTILLDRSPDLTPCWTFDVIQPDSTAGGLYPVPTPAHTTTRTPPIPPPPHYLQTHSPPRMATGHGHSQHYTTPQLREDGFPPPTPPPTALPATPAGMDPRGGTTPLPGRASFPTHSRAAGRTGLRHAGCRM